MTPSKDLNKIVQAEQDIAYIKGKLRYGQLLERNDHFLVIALFMMLYYILCESLRDPEEPANNLSEYVSRCIFMLVMDAAIRYISSEQVRLILNKFDEQKVQDAFDDPMQFKELENDIQIAMAWIDNDWGTHSKVDRYLRPVLHLSCIGAAHSITGNMGSTIAVSSILMTKLIEQVEETALPKRIKPN